MTVNVHTYTGVRLIDENQIETVKDWYLSDFVSVPSEGTHSEMFSLSTLLFLPSLSTRGGNAYERGVKRRLNSPFILLLPSIVSMDHTQWCMHGRVAWRIVFPKSVVVKFACCPVRLAPDF